MSPRDVRGVPVSTGNAHSLARYERAAELTVGYAGDPLALIDEALAEDPELAIGHCLRAGLALMSSEKAALPMVAASVAAVAALGARAHDRERAHAAAGRLFLAGDFPAAVQAYGRILLDHPRDLLALQIAHVGDFLLGDAQMLRDRVAGVLPHWDASVPGYGYVLGMYAFGLEETALHRRAEDAGRQALALQRRDPWAIHAVTHVMEMEARVGEGIRFLEGCGDDWTGGGLSCHNFWHLALFHLELGEPAGALAIYDRAIRPAPTDVAYENVDAGGLLWRLTLRGVEVGDRWRALAESWEPSAEDAFYAFNDLFAVIAFAAAGRTDLVGRTLAAMERARGSNEPVTREVAMPLARAVVAFTRGAHDECIELLLKIRTVTHRLGGSAAQRDLVHLTLLEAALRGGHAPLARALAAERTALKPASPFNWLLTARALELAGDPRAAAARAESVKRRNDQHGV
jgi:tetratricopeptide (TPR) repeat protein